LLLCEELESEDEIAAERNVADFCDTQNAGIAAECVELQDLEQPSGEFSRLMAEDDVAEPAKPSTWRQIKALMKIRLLSERRMPSLWLARICIPVFFVLLGALRWMVPTGLSASGRFELKPGHYVNDSSDSQSTVNPALAFQSTTPEGLFFVSYNLVKFI